MYSPGDEGIISTLLSPVRAGKQAKDKLEKVNAVATDQAMVVNMLSGAGTNVRSRADEMRAMRMDMQRAASTDGSLPVSGGDAPAGKPFPARPRRSSDGTSPAPPAPTGPASTKALADSVVKGVKRAAGLMSVQKPDSGEVPGPEAGKPAPSPPGTGAAADGVGASVDVGATGQPEDPSLPEWNAAWRGARDSIKVTGVGRSSQKAYALLGGKLVRVGGLYRVSYQGSNYLFRLRDIDSRDKCDWAPVPRESATGAIGLATF
jgi:hypothetical protein